MFASWLAWSDRWLGRVAMYRFVIYYLGALIGIAVLGCWRGSLAYPPSAVLGSTALLVVACVAINALFASVFGAPRNDDSAIISGLILALIAGPARTRDDYVFLAWTATLAMASKYILARHRLHLFNPAAVALVLTGAFAGRTASWWVGTGHLTPFVIAGGLLLVRRIRRGDLVASFLGVTLCVTLAWNVWDGIPFSRGIYDAPAWFLAFVMLTEPVTVPPTKPSRVAYGVLTGVLVAPQFHVAGIYSTPELALVAANAVAFAIGPRQRHRLSLDRATPLGPGLMDFVYLPSPWFAYHPGQYMEWTLDHRRVDSRGKRRYFTLASSPTERTLRIGVKFAAPGSTYKQAMLAHWERGAPIVASQVAGDFTLPRNPDRKLAFIAGGIGVTPFRSMVKYLTDLGENRDIVMLYANRSYQEILYRDVFETARCSLAFRPVYVLSDASSSPHRWEGERGRIDAPMIARQIPDYRERQFYVSGSPELVQSALAALHALGVKPRQIKTDSFSGL
jgi:ferredoxin-NADP reductase/Na+-translocating ferredoxin:NAD+ oxidoreductase RnfD subunit